MHPEMSNIHDILDAIERERPPAGLRDRILQACEHAEPAEEISCAEALELASAYLDDEVRGSRRDAFEAHVFTCESCYAAFKQMERTTELLRETPPATAPAGLHRRITAAVARDSAPAPFFTWRRAAATLGGLAAAAALLAAVFVPRGGDGVHSSAPVIAEAPPEVAGAPADDARVADEPVEPEPAADETPEMTTTEPSAETVVAAAPRSVRATTTVRSTPGTSVTREEAPESAPAPAPPREPVREGRVGTSAPQPRPERCQPATQPRRSVDQPETHERRTPRPEPEPVTADERPTPTPVRERTPEPTPEPPARTPQPRETVIAATPRDPDPQPASTSETTSEPAATASATRPQPTAGPEPTRVASVVPTQAPVRARYQPAPTSISERSEKLARMNAGINGSQNPAQDNPTMGIELN